MTSTRQPPGWRWSALATLVLALVAWQRASAAAPEHGFALPVALLAVPILAQFTGATDVQRYRLAHAARRA